MPVIFVHGVNTRTTDSNYDKNVQVRTDLIKAIVLDELAKTNVSFRDLQVIFPYWGDDGVQFRWNNATVPDVDAPASSLEALGGAGEATPLSDIGLMQTVARLAGPQAAAGEFETMGAESGSSLKQAAEADLTALLEAIVLPVVLSELSLDETGATSSVDLGHAEARLAIAVLDVGRDPVAIAAVADAASDDELLDVLKQRVLQRYRELASPPGPDSLELEPLGVGFLDKALERIGNVFDRAKDASVRVATQVAVAPLVDRVRLPLQGVLGRFFGDVFVYLQHRGDKDNPGPIVQRVLQPIRAAQAQRPNEPLIVITHSMGGNILYDILTHFAPDIEIDVWISAGTQVGQFEEMKLFVASQQAVGQPQKVSGLKPRVGYWLNVYDPIDIFGYKTAPVFADVDADVTYITGSPPPLSHSAYFGLASFYELVRVHIQKWIENRP